MDKKNDSEPTKWTKVLTVKRYVGALFIYLIYWLTIWGAIRQVAAILSPEQAEELIEAGIINSVWEYGWGDHYIWFLIAFCFATYCSAVLAGATAKKKGAIVACIANLPIIGFLSYLCVCLYISLIEIENSVTWKIIFPVSILGSIYLSVVGGAAGERWQNNTFSSKTILGIRPIHWWWLIFPIHFVIQMLIPKIRSTLYFLFSGPLITETKYGVLSFLMFVACATAIYFIVWGWVKTFRLLSIKHKTSLGKCRIVLSVLFYLWGIPLLFDAFFVLIYILTQ